MKRIIIYILFLTAIVACDPNDCVIYKINNLTNDNIILYLNDNSFKIDKRGSYILQDFNCSLGGIPPLGLQMYDSIYFKDISNNFIKIYQPNDLKKNICNYENDWNINRISKNSYEYTFEITDEDIGN